MAEDINQDQTLAPEQAPQAEEPNNRLVKILRAGDEPATCIGYEDGSGEMRTWYPEANKNEFQVKAIIAAAAVASGFFVEAPESKTKLKKS